MRKITILLFHFLWVLCAQAQETFPVNGTADERAECFAFVNATIVKDAASIIPNTNLVIRKGKIVGVGIEVPKDAVTIDCKGKYIYPSFIDLYSDYGVTPAGNATDVGSRRMGFGQAQQFVSNTKGAYGWNQAIKPEVNAFESFQLNEAKAKEMRSIGFGTVLSNNQDGIARGTAALVTLGSQKENFEMVTEKAAAFYSFNKGTSTQDYPGSLMGCIALIRQSYLDAQWYKGKPATEGVNLSLQAWNDIQALPQIFDIGTDKFNALRANAIAQEFKTSYILKGTNDLYQRMEDVKKLKASFIIPLNFPQPMDVEDPNDARIVAYADMKHWEMAPSQPAMLEKAGVMFSLTANGLTSAAEFLTNLRKAIQNGLSEKTALEALTKNPATLINQYAKVGSLEAGKLANFFIASNNIFKDSSSILQNWVQGKRYSIKDDGWNDYRGKYTLVVNGTTPRQYTAVVKGTADKPALSITAANDSTAIAAPLTISDKMVKINWNTRADAGRQNNLSGMLSSGDWAGTGYLASGESVTWKMTYVAALPPDTARVASTDTSRRGGAFANNRKPTPATIDDVVYPFNGYGWKQAPKQEKLLIKNTTVWTNEKEGRLENTDVLLDKGKIAAIGKNLSSADARIIDGAGKHLTAGVIDEHSHIAITGGVNECTQSVTSEVRIGDVLNPEDINIYRQLAGGVTSSHLLHGSCNPVGGQTQLVKLRWGLGPDDMKFTNWDPFIKFALGENVKRSSSTTNNRFPDSRMGVEQTYVDAFQRAQDYLKQGPGKRKDLKLEALVEILQKKRFITCHSYVQSEINMLMKVAEKFGFTVNTFTHILEGYKVADKMKTHGVKGASTFSDWWAYKMEVQDAIAYNPAIMEKVGLTVAVNSDDAEMARRLNQEAAKSVKYGGVAEEQALKMVTLNPAIMLHVADRVGSIKIGKDADVVLWSDNPLSSYAKSMFTIIDGTVYFDREKDVDMRKALATERNRLIQKLLAEKRNGSGGAGSMMMRARPRLDEINECEIDHKHKHSILERDDD